MKRITAGIFSLLLIFFVSCGGPRIVIDERTEINKNYATGNISGLILNLAEYPFYRNHTETLLFDKFDYTRKSYSEIKEYAQLARFDFDASVFFDSLMIHRQENVLQSLANSPMESVGEFYRRNHKEHEYLFEHLKKVYFSDVGSLDYVNLRNLHKAFHSTDLGMLLDERYYFLRDSILNITVPYISDYFQLENEMLNEIEGSLRHECNDYVIAGTNSIIQALMLKNDRGFIKRVFKRETIDTYSFMEYAEILINNHLSPKHIRDLVCKKLDNYVVSTKSYRENLYDNLLPHLSCNDYYINNTYENINLSWQIGRQDVQTISSIKVTGTALTLGSIAVGFIPGVGPLVTFAADVVDFAYGMTQDSQINLAMESLTQTLYEDSIISIDKYIEDVFAALREESQRKQSELMKMIYEEF